MKNKWFIIAHVLFSESRHVANDWSKVCRPMEFDHLKALAISGHNTFNAVAVRIFRVEIDVKIVQRSGGGREKAAESKHRKLLIRVVVLQYIANSSQCLFVLSRPSFVVMQRIFLGRILVRCCEQNTFSLKSLTSYSKSYL